MMALAAGLARQPFVVAREFDPKCPFALGLARCLVEKGNGADEPTRPTPVVRNGAVVEIRAPPRCLGCGATEGVRRCSGCLVTVFCSNACQTKAWPEHRRWCSMWEIARGPAKQSGIVLQGPTDVP
jgi:hypothetical protein